MAQYEFKKEISSSNKFILPRLYAYFEEPWLTDREGALLLLEFVSRKFSIPITIEAAHNVPPRRLQDRVCQVQPVHVQALQNENRERQFEDWNTRAK